MTALADIVSASASWSPWLRDALRRIVEQEDLSAGDLDALATLCKQPHGLATLEAPPHFLNVSALGVHPSGSRAISFVEVTHVADVNALAPGESLKLEPTGVTVVYGDNGAGKSGYTRILKRLCRARGSGGPVLPNALSEIAAGTPAARVRWSIDGSIQEHHWLDGSEAPHELSEIGVFDAASAQVHITAKTEARFRPFGLDVIDRLVAACAQVRARIQEEYTALERSKPQWPSLTSGTAAAQLAGNISALTTAATIDNIVDMSETEIVELQTLREALESSQSNDPTKRAREIKVQATRLSTLAQWLGNAQTQFSEESIADLHERRHQAIALRAEADAAARQSAAPLDGVGSATWRAMWKAAAQYGELVAHRDVPFPSTDPSARCVLCQQQLDELARTRLQAFADLVRGEIEARASAAAKAVLAKEEALLAVNLDLVTPETAEELGALDAAMGERLIAIMDDLRVAISSIRAHTTPIKSPPLADHVRRLSEAQLAKSIEFLKAADPAERTSLEKRYRELAARAMLAPYKSMLHAEVVRKQRLQAYDACLRDLQTQQLTRLSTDLTKKYVTETLTSGFAEELKRLNFVRPEIKLAPAGGQKGTLYHQISLQHATRAELHKIVSDGEGRCIALAAFLAELKTSGTASAIVFDDPVSSLDHRWRTRIAERLVAEGAIRQVVIFTHELVFLTALQTAAKRTGVACATRTLRWRGGTAGHVDEELPWAALSTSVRIGVLKSDLQAARKVLKDDSQERYELLATRIYARLRQTWERAVEEVLLNDVVVRFRQSVETNRLKKLTLVTSEDVQRVDMGMTKSSRWEGGHDHASAINEPMPHPDEVASDIEAVELFVNDLRKRKPLSA